MTSRPAKANPRTVLLGALIFMIVGTALYAAAPWLLPVRIVEGPMLQQAGADAATLVWYTTCPMNAGDCEVTITSEPESWTLSAEADGTRGRVRIEGLLPGQAYPYRIHVGSRTLAAATLHTNVAADCPYSFAVFGDSGRGTQQQYRLAQQMVSSKPDFLLHVGDLVYPDGARQRYKNRFFAPYRHLLAEVNFWPCLGNHDIEAHGEEVAYLGVFELPENGPAGEPAECNYWFDYASARIAVIDSSKYMDEAALTERIAPWLRETMTGCDAAWKFIALHHAPYTAGVKYGPDQRIIKTLVPVFEAVGIDIVFAGHDHLYERMLPLRTGQIAEPGQGIVYIVTGAGGAALYAAKPPAERPAYVAALENQRHSFTFVQIDGHDLRLQQIDLNGELVDEWAMTKTLPPPMPPAEDEPETQPAADRTP